MYSSIYNDEEDVGSGDEVEQVSFEGLDEEEVEEVGDSSSEDTDEEAIQEATRRIVAKQKAARQKRR